MTLVTIHAVVDIPAHVRVMEIVGVPAPMASGTLENRVVGRTCVAGGAHAVSIAVINVEPGVVERCAGPGSRVVTSRASSCENCWRGGMDRIGSSSIIRRMTAIAIRREGGVVVVYMATGAGHFHVKARQREGSRVVVELAIGPDNRVVAKIASRGKPDLNMVNRRGGRIVILQMA